MRVVWGSAVLGLLISCGGEEEEERTGRRHRDLDTGQTFDAQCPDGFYEGDITLSSASVSCEGDRLRLDGETEGWASGGFLILQDTAGITEEHEVVDTQFDMCGEWCLIEQEVTTGATSSSWAPNQSTAVACEGLTWAVGIHDLDGNLVDCRVFGADPTALLDHLAATQPSCRLANDL